METPTKIYSSSMLALQLSVKGRCSASEGCDIAEVSFAENHFVRLRSLLPLSRDDCLMGLKFTIATSSNIL